MPQVAAMAPSPPAAAADAPFRGSFAAFELHAEPRPVPAVAFVDPAGGAHALADFHGRVVLLNFWATWCAPCVEEMPSLDRLQAELGDRDLVVLALSVDRGGYAEVGPFLDRLQVAHLARYLDAKSAAMRAFGVRGLPTSVLIDRQGREVGRLEGPADWHAAAIQAFIRSYFASSS
ncbi:MAG: TlpA family protein disulfide reductase [Proteobacteria bacterium]|nr:TlpA family protein disulfide reductase [Pseudomonadota bacterium]